MTQDKINSERLLSKKKLKNMTPDELLDNAKWIDNEITERGLGMLFG